MQNAGPLCFTSCNFRNNEREAEGSGNVVFEKDAENFVDGEKE